MPLDLEDEEQEQGTADGVKKITEFLPFSNTSLSDFMTLLEETFSEGKLTLDSLKMNFYQNQDWQLAFELNSDIKLDQFLESSMFVLNNS